MPLTKNDPSREKPSLEVHLVFHAGAPGIAENMEDLIKLYKSTSYLEGRIQYFRTHFCLLRLFTELETALKNVESSLDAVFTISLPAADLQPVQGSTSELTCSKEAFNNCRSSDIHAINFKKGSPFREPVCIQLEQEELLKQEEYYSPTNVCGI